MRFIPFDDTALLTLGKSMTCLFHKTETKVIPKIFLLGKYLTYIEISHQVACESST